MRKSHWLCALFFAIALTSLVSAQPAQAADVATKPAKQVFDYVYVVDTSGSMNGKGTGKPAVIMPQVKAAIIAQIAGLEDGATVVIMPFNQGVKGTKKFQLTGPDARRAATQYVNSLSATGSGTWIYSSMLQALSQAEAIVAKSPDNHVQTVLLYTDGLDNEPGKKHSFGDVAKEFNLQRGEADNLWLKYITLGVKAPTADRNIVAKTEGMELLENPKGKVLPLYNVEVRPYRLDFGNLRRVQESSATVRFGYAKGAAGLPFTVTIEEDRLLALGITPVIEPGSAKLSEKLLLTLHLENAAAIAELEDAEFNGMITFKSTSGLQFAPPQLPFTFRVRDEPVVSIAPEDQSAAISALGTLKRSRNSVTPVSRKWLVRWTHPDKKSNVTLRVWPSEKNPTGLDSGAIVLVTSSGQKGESVSLTAEDKWVALQVKPGADAAAGQYDVPVYVSGERVELEITGAESSTKSPGQYEIPTGFEIPKRPLALASLLLILMSVLALILLVAFVLYCAITGQSPARAWRDLLFMTGVKKPVFGMDQLVIREPKQDSGRTFPLQGRSKVLIGSGGEFLGETAVSLRLEAYWKRRGLRARAIAVDGDPGHRQAGESFDMPFAEQEIVGGDLIRLGSHLVQFESGDIV